MTTDVLIGVTLPQFTDDPEVFVDGARRAEDGGLDSVWIFDHLWPLSGGKERPIIECWTALAWVAASTARVGVGTLVTRSSLRHPAVLAKEAATVSAIAPGRVTLVIGSGDDASRPENEAFGIPYYAEEERVAQLASTVGCVRDYLRGEPFDRSDDFVAISSLPPSPVGERPPPVWVGGRAGDTLEVAGRLADGWNGWGGGPVRYAQDAVEVADAAEGRPLELSWGGVGILARDDTLAFEKLGDRNPKRYLVGGPETVGRRLLRFVEAGARHLMITLPDAADPEMYELVAGPIRDVVRRG